MKLKAFSSLSFFFSTLYMKGRYIIMLNFVIGFFVGMLTLYIGFNIYARYQIHKMIKEAFPDVDYDEVIKHINEMEPINKK